VEDDEQQIHVILVDDDEQSIHRIDSSNPQSSLVVDELDAHHQRQPNNSIEYIKEIENSSLRVRILNDQEAST